MMSLDASNNYTRGGYRPKPSLGLLITRVPIGLNKLLVYIFGGLI